MASTAIPGSPSGFSKVRFPFGLFQIFQHTGAFLGFLPDWWPERVLEDEAEFVYFAFEVI